MRTHVRWLMAGVGGVLATFSAAGEPVEIGQFGRPLTDSSGIEWNMPREVTELRVLGSPQVAAERLRVEWWGSGG